MAIPKSYQVYVRSDQIMMMRVGSILVSFLLLALSISTSTVVQDGRTQDVPITTQASYPAGSDDDFQNATKVYAELPGPTNDMSFGTYLNYAGDITGDGCDDILQFRRHTSSYPYMVLGSRDPRAGCLSHY